MRVGLAALYHETNTFAVEHNDKLDAHVKTGTEILDHAHPKSFIGGFVEAARSFGIEIVPAADVRFWHGGVVHREVYKHYRQLIVDRLQKAGPVDGVYFALHGAMVAEAPFTDAEGELLRECRRVLGASIPFVATYDFHTICSDYEASQLAAAFPNNTNPHIDNYEQGTEAATAMSRILTGQWKPVTRRVAVPIIGPNIGQSTWSHRADEEFRLPLYQLNLVRQEMEKIPGVINLAILGGYGYADTPDSCMSVMAVTNGDPDLADRLAKELARQVWHRREEILNIRPIYPIDEGVTMAMERPGNPWVLVDLGDDPGSYCPADSPAVLEALIRMGARDCALTIRDPNVVKAGLAAGVGAALEMEVGASVDQRFYKPVRVRGVVKLIDDGNYLICGPSHGGWGREVTPDQRREVNAGPRVVLRLENKIDVIFGQGPTGKDRDFFKSAGVLLEEKKILVVKSNQAHRASFDPVAAGNIDLDTPGVSTVNYTRLPYRQLPRPMWPIDRDFDWRP